MSNKLKVTVNGKINLSLNILGADGGYHLLDMILASVNIADAIILSKRDDNKVNITYKTDNILAGGRICGGEINRPDRVREVNTVKQSNENSVGTNPFGTPSKPDSVTAAVNSLRESVGDYIGTNPFGTPSKPDSVTAAVNSLRESVGDFIGTNPFGTPSKPDSVTTAVNSLRESVGDFGADIIVDKRLPLGGGMGGSSADAAGVIEGLNYLLKLNLSPRERAAIGLKAGSDVPYMLNGGFARITGRGERVNSFNSGAEISGIILLDGSPVTAAEAYAKFDQLNPDKIAVLSDNDKIVELLQNSDMSATKFFDNALTAASVSLNSNIARNIELAKKSGALKSFMTGSGSSVVAIFDSLDSALKASQSLSKVCDVCPFTTLNKGISFD